MTKDKQIEELQLSLGQLRHLYWNMINGNVKPDQNSIARIADGILSPEIKRLEKLAESFNL